MQDESESSRLTKLAEQSLRQHYVRLEHTKEAAHTVSRSLAAAVVPAGKRPGDFFSVSLMIGCLILFVCVCVWVFQAAVVPAGKRHRDFISVSLII
jgi:hypothetical protein